MFLFLFLSDTQQPIPLLSCPAIKWLDSLVFTAAGRVPWVPLASISRFDVPLLKANFYFILTRHLVPVITNGDDTISLLTQKELTEEDISKRWTHSRFLDPMLPCSTYKNKTARTTRHISAWVQFFQDQQQIYDKTTKGSKKLVANCQTWVFFLSLEWSLGLQVKRALCHPLSDIPKVRCHSYFRTSHPSHMFKSVSV